MFFLGPLLTIAGLVVFEVVSSIDNAVINAEVLATLSQKGRRWFLFWGLLFAVFIVRGLLPWLLVFAVMPSLGPFGALFATFKSGPEVQQAIASASPLLFMGGGVFLVFLFLHWLFLEPKVYGLRGERFFHSQGAWFYALVSIFLTFLVWFSLQQEKMLAFAAVLGSTAFFITHGFKANAEVEEKKLLKSKKSDLSKIFYLEVIDATFSIDGVLGAFAFTLSVPLILLGNGLGALILRQLTIGNIERIRRFKYLKNGAMYSVLFLGTFMVLEGLGFHIPSGFSPLTTLFTIGYFWYKSQKELRV